jgi:hypothetical protein
LAETSYILVYVCIYTYAEIQYDLDIVEFEVLTAVVLRSTLFWYTKPYSPLKVNRIFEGNMWPILRG